ncbi:uncharacterized protein LOC133890514 isoform X2 [Phragmites australis]|uniref:uncharacterized protein LOC133890514 isoform X2 n=1 Tax=Phragmites australis TaxID=29695 RepID=UPI002D76AE04|nr:uncharacterized protein LOC133890514 isoform X2 [Phragmites australis]
MTFGSDGWSKKNPKSSGNQAWNLYCILIAYGSSLGEGTMDDLLSVLAARSHIVFDGFHPSIVLVELGECVFSCACGRLPARPWALAPWQKMVSMSVSLGFTSGSNCGIATAVSGIIKVRRAKIASTPMECSKN